MVKIAPVSSKRRKRSVLSIFLAAIVVGCIVFYITGNADDASLGSLLLHDFGTNTVTITATATAISADTNGAGSATGGDPQHMQQHKQQALQGKSDLRSEDSEIPQPVALKTKDQSFSTAIISDGVASDPLSTNNKTASLSPVSCHDFLTKGYRQANGEREAGLNPNNDQIRAFLTKNFTHNFWFSMHHNAFDPTYDYVSGYYKREAWTRTVIKILEMTTPSDGRVLDVGAQVGWISLLARATGRDVDAFEPLRQNVFRFCESLFLNHWSNNVEQKYSAPFVNIHHLALKNQIDSEHGSMTMLMRRNGASACLEGDDEHINVPVTTLDDFVKERRWIEQKEPIALLKIHTSGMDDVVLNGANTLLTSKLVKHILIWGARNSNVVSVLLRAGYMLNKWGAQLDHEASELQGDLATALASKSIATDSQISLWFTL